MSVLLEIEELYGGYEKDVNILQGIDLSVSEGEAVGIIGLNGSGKSTLGKAIMNLIPYRRGSIVFEGHHIENKSPHELAQIGISLMHQGGTVFPNLSVWQNLQLAWGNNADKDYYDSLVEIIPLLQIPERDLKRQMADKLSGGQRHQLALAMTLACHPKLVVLDEPSAGLSPQAIMELYSQGKECPYSTSMLSPGAVSKINGILVRLKESLNISIILVEQNISLATSICDRCLMVEQGAVIQEFKEETLKKDIIECLMFKK